MPPSIELRTCTDRDLHRMVEIVNAAALAYRGAIPEDCWHEPYMPLHSLQSEIDAGVRFLGAERAGHLVGILGTQPVQDVLLVRHAYVDPLFQRHGVGSALLRAALSGVDRPVLVGTWAAAIWAIRFYQRNGFTLLDRPAIEAKLRRYWTIPERQIEASVVLARASTPLPAEA